MVKLTVLHEIDVPKAKLIDAVSMGWPAILSSLKSVLETGRALSIKMEPPKEMLAALERLTRGA
jgi:hypothetical protein